MKPHRRLFSSDGNIIRYRGGNFRVCTLSRHQSGKRGVLDTISDEKLKSLIHKMLAWDPALRITAKDALEICKDFFPNTAPHLSSSTPPMSKSKTYSAAVDADGKCRVASLEFNRDATKASLLSRVSYMSTVADSDQSLHVRNSKGNEWTISGKIVENECFCADTFDKTETFTSREELVQMLLHAGETVYTVFYESSDGSATKKRGYTIKTETVFGRTLMWSWDDGAPRLVDHRTVSALILRNTKYEFSAAKRKRSTISTTFIIDDTDVPPKKRGRRPRT